MDVITLAILILGVGFIIYKKFLSRIEISFQWSDEWLIPLSVIYYLIIGYFIVSELMK